MKVLIGNYPKHRWYHTLFGVTPQRVKIVKIDSQDTWSMDHTLALIIHPMLIQLHDSGQGCHAVDQEDAPHITFFDGKYSEEAWSYVLGEMIWAFEQQLKDDDESQFYDHSECGDLKDIKDWNERISKVKVDNEGLEAHQKRKANGFRLFGKY